MYFNRRNGRIASQHNCSIKSVPDRESLTTLETSTSAPCSHVMQAMLILWPADSSRQVGAVLSGGCASDAGEFLGVASAIYLNVTKR